MLEFLKFRGGDFSEHIRCLAEMAERPRVKVGYFSSSQGYASPALANPLVKLLEGESPSTNQFAASQKKKINQF